MKQVCLKHKLNQRGWPVCNFPDCNRKVIPQEYSGYRLCETHYQIMYSIDSGCYVPMCNHEECYQIYGLQKHSQGYFCKLHYDSIIKTYRMHKCEVDHCHRRAIDNLNGVYKCHVHIKSSQCNRIGCLNLGTVKGFNSQWCDKHYLEMCHVRENITHDYSLKECKFRFKEMQIRKDSYTKTGKYHKWYLQILAQSLV